MREFAEIRAELDLHKFLESPLGTQYSSQFKPPHPFVIVRHFDANLSPEEIVPYVELLRAAHDWVVRRPELARFVQIELPIEVGRDFVARKRHVYYTSTRSYTEDEPSAPEPPPELAQMRAVFLGLAGKSANPRDGIVERVLARSLLEDSGKTYEGESGFVVVEPKLTVEDVRRWMALGSPAKTNEPKLPG